MAKAKSTSRKKKTFSDNDRQIRNILMTIFFIGFIVTGAISLNRSTLLTSSDAGVRRGSVGCSGQCSNQRDCATGLACKRGSCRPIDPLSGVCPVNEKEIGQVGLCGSCTDNIDSDKNEVCQLGLICHNATCKCAKTIEDGGWVHPDCMKTKDELNKAVTKDGNVCNPIVPTLYPGYPRPRILPGK